MRWWFAATVGWILGCAGAGPSPRAAPPPPAPEAAPTPAPTPVDRIVRTGPISEVRWVELTPNGPGCDASMRWFGGGPGGVAPLKSFDQPCPSVATVTWTDHRLVLAGPQLLVSLIGAPIDLPKVRPGERIEAAAFDDDQVLHVCGRTDAPVVREGTDAVVTLDGAPVERGIGAVEDGFEVAVHWVDTGEGWMHQVQLAAHTAFDPPRLDACASIEGFPSRFASSEPPVVSGEWPAVPAAEAARLEPTGGIGGWSWDPSHTLAVGGYGFTQYRMWVDGGWVEPQRAGWIGAGWALPDFLVLTGSIGGVDVFSRRTGRRVLSTGPNTLVIPLPDGVFANL